MDKDAFVDQLNEDLSTEFQSIVQYVQHIATITGPEYMNLIGELKIHLSQELQHAITLSEQVAFLGGTPITTVTPIAVASDSKSALQSDLKLEQSQLGRYRERFAQANDLNLPDVAEAIRPLLEQTQEHVRDLETGLGQ
jgi:bacterioferritin